MKARLRRFVQLWIRLFAKHELLDHAGAIAFQVLKGLIPLTLLGLALLGALGEESVWTNTVAPGMKSHVQPATFNAISDAVQRIFSTESAGLIAFAGLLAILVLSVAVGLLVRFAPAEPRSKRWAGAGTALVIGAWIVATLIFKLFVSDVANFKAAIGNLTVFLVLTGYVYTSSIIFLVGVSSTSCCARTRGPASAECSRSCSEQANRQKGVTWQTSPR